MYLPVNYLMYLSRHDFQLQRALIHSQMYAQSEQIARCDERILIKNRSECTQWFNKIPIPIRRQGKTNSQQTKPTI